MTITQGIKRLGAPIAALFAAALIALVAMSWLIDRNAVRQSVEQQIRTVTGLDIVVGGDVDISVFPNSYVTLHQVGLKGAKDTLSIDELKANLRLLPLLMRRFEIADVAFMHPRIHVQTVNGHSNWSPIVDMLIPAIKPDNPASFSEIRVTNGAIIYKDDTHPGTETVDNIDVSLAWPSISRSFAATGQFTWRGERIDGSVSIADFIAALSGERSGLKARIATAPLKFAFDGAIANRASLMLEGTLSADGPSLRHALRWTGQISPGDHGLGRFSLKARTNIVGGSVALTNVNVEVDGNVAEGVITYNNSDRKTIQATLAAETLDFTPYMETLRLVAKGARDWNRQLFDLRGLSAADLDMRLSAAKVTVGNSKLGRTALGANLRNGTLALTIGEAQIYGGVVKGSLGVTRADTAVDVKAQFQFNDIDLEASGNDLLGTRKLSGRGNMNVALEASGSSPFALTQTLDGSVTLTGRSGTINDLNIEQLLRRLERRPLSGAGNFRNGTTPFDLINVTVNFNKGLATAEDIRIEGPTARLTLSGTASVPSREYDLKGIASLVSTADATPAFQLPFVVQGPWDDPLIFPDSDALIRRSPASAPLLDALKDRKAGDAVRAVIDRLTGAHKAADTPASDSTSSEKPN